MTRARLRTGLVALFATLGLVGAACANGSNASSGGGPYGGGPAAGGSTGSTVAAGGSTGGTTGSSGGGGAYGGSSGGRYGYGNGGGSGGGGQGSGSGAQMSDAALTADNFAFTPTDVQAKSGTAIMVANANASTPHSFTVDGTSIDVTLDPGTVGSVHVNLDPGTYSFHCRYHASMTGSLTVT